MTETRKLLQLQNEQRRRLTELADELMPAGETLPRPSEIEIGGMWIDMALAATPSMYPVLKSVLEKDGSAHDVIKKLRDETPEQFLAFSFFLAGAYFMHPQVRAGLGYEGQAIEKNPPLEGEAEFFLEDDLMQPVIDRGPIYRQL